MIRLHISGRSCGGGSRKSPKRILIRSNGIVLGQAILVASETAPGLLQRVWAEMDYLLDVFRATKCGHTCTTYDALRGGVLFPSVGRLLQTFPPFNCTDFFKCVRGF